jgi:septal ring factor EnvC (AmiA/AmiB activator)
MAQRHTMQYNHGNNGKGRKAREEVMTSRIIRVAALTLIAGLAGGSISGCVLGSTFEQAQREAERRLYNEQRTSQELADANKRLKQRVDELESALRTAREDLVRTERIWKETRDELLKLKIEQEQLPRSRERLSQLEKPSLPSRTDDTIRRLKDLLRQLQAALDQLPSRDPL